VAVIFSTQQDMRPFVQESLARIMGDPEPPTPLSQSSHDSHGSQATEVSPLLQSGSFLMQPSGQVLQLSAPPAKTLAMVAEAPKPLSHRLRMMVDNMVLEMRELGAVLILGSAIAAFVQVAIPRDLVLGLGQGPVTSIVAMMALAWVVSICSTVDSFFALSFASTFTSGALLAFLVFGPMIDLKNISLLLTVFKSRAILYLFVLAAQLTFLLCLVMNFYIL